MPKFMDHHPMPAVSPEMAAQIQASIASGRVDQFGVKGLSVFMGEGEAWCVSEAADVDAVCKSHEALGIKLERGQVAQVQSIP